MTPTIRAMAAILTVFVVSFTSNGAWTAEVTAPSGPAARPSLPPELQGKPRGNWAKADGAIRGLVAEFLAHRDRGSPGEFSPSNATLQFTRGRLVVDIVAADDPQALLGELRRLGLRDASVYGRIISGRIPPGAIARAVELQDLRAISAARRPLTNSSHGAGSVISEGVEAMYADNVQADGITGANIVIGVLSDSFDHRNGYADGQASGDLPPGILVLDDSGNGGSGLNDEGRGMMELAYDVAPGSNFAFHTAFGGMADFANGILELQQDGANIIVDDVIYFAEPMFQDGVIAQAVDDVVALGVPYFSSAGNFARMSYEADYVNSGEPWYVNSGSGNEYRGVLHDFDPGAGTDWHQDLEIPDYTSHRILTLVLQWDQPFASLSSGNTGAEVDLDVYLTDTADPSTLLASSVDNNAQHNGGNGEPLELLQFQVGGCDFFLEVFNGIGCVPDPGTFRLQIAYYDGGTNAVPGADPIEPTRLKYVLFDRSIGLQYATNSSTTFGHANAAGAEAVAAAFWQATPAWGCDDPTTASDDTAPTYDDCEQNAQGQLTPQLESFSSAGGTPIFFDVPAGNPVDELRLKPEVTGPDGTNTTFFFSDSDTDLDSWPNFFGTSASAPHVAAVAALIREADPSLSPAQIYEVLETTARNMNPRPNGEPEQADGFDFDTGWGFVQADLALAAVSGGVDARPTVAVTAPADGATVAGTVSVTADASDDDAVSQVEFFVNDTISLGIDSDGSDGWSAAWDSTPYGDGPHMLTATATDSAGQTASDSVTVTADNVDDPPSVSVTGPADGATVSGTVTIRADAADDRSVSQVEFFADGTSIGTDTDDSNGWSATWDSTTAVDGSSHTLTATATDGGSNTASDSVTVTADNSIAANEPPVASFTVTENPCPFEPLLDGWVCQFNNTSEDDGGDSNMSAEWDYGDGTGTTVWSPTAVYSVPGTYTVTLTVTDSEDASDSTSQSVAMAVSAHLGDLDAARVSSGGRWEAQVIALVLDNRSAPLEGAVVEGSWSNGANGNGNCTTGANGQCTISKNNLKNNVDSVTFTVNNIGGPNIAYAASANVDPDGDSYGADENMIDVGQSADTSTNEPPVASFSVTENPCPRIDDDTFNLHGWLCDFNNTSSDDGGVPTASWEWDYGDGTNETAVWEPDALYEVEGFYTVTLTVTDSEGASDSASLQVQIGNPETPSLFLESAEGFKDKGVQHVNLTWSGGPAGDVEVQQNGVGVLQTPNDGAETYNIGNKGGGSYNFRICEPDGNNCSNTIQVVF